MEIYIQLSTDITYLLLNTSGYKPCSFGKVLRRSASIASSFTRSDDTPTLVSVFCSYHLFKIPMLVSRTTNYRVSIRHCYRYTLRNSFANTTETSK